MNDRIKELAKQAGFMPDNFISRWDAEFVLFAELIVKEIEKQGRIEQSITVSNASDDYNSGREMAIEVFINKIKQHFGVEE